MFAAGLILLAAAFVSWWLRDLGFPDGHLTEWDRARRVLGNLFTGTSVAAGLGLFFLGARARKHAIARPLRIALVVYVAFTLVMLGLDQYLGVRLDRGGGG